MLLTIVLFLLCAAVIIAGGWKLSEYGDELADVSGLGRSFIGLVLLAATTSLPELLSSTSAAIAGIPALAVGNILGACMINLLLLALIDALGRRFYPQVVQYQTQTLAAAFGIILVCLVAVAVLAADLLPMVLWVSPVTFVLLGVYLLAIRATYLDGKARVVDMPNQAYEAVDTGPKRSARPILLRYAAAAAPVVIAAIFLPQLADEIATFTGLGGTLVGTVLLAVVTTLPELVVTISAVRLGAMDMAVGNVFGSNLFNLAILGLTDLFYTGGSAYVVGGVAASLVLAVTVLTMYGVAMAGNSYQALRRVRILTIDGWALILVYGLGIAWLFSVGG